MQSFTFPGSLGSQAVCWISVEPEHLSSNLGDVCSQGRGFYGKFRAAQVVKPNKKSLLKGWGVYPGGLASATADFALNGRGAVGAGQLGRELSPVVTSQKYLNVLSSLITEPSDNKSTANPIQQVNSSEKKIFDVVVKQASLFQEQKEKEGSGLDMPPGRNQIVSPKLLAEAYARCGEVCAEHAKTFYLGTKLMTPERQRAIWAIYVWCRRTDELVDGPNASRITPTALDRWEERLEDVFKGQPYDMLDAALADTVARFPVDIQPFRDMIDGMRMDLVKSRYSNFDELYLYCYNVAGTVGLMSVPVMGIAPDSKATTESVYGAALALGIANQLTNILRDVGEDARRSRIYLPQDELHQFGLSDEDIFAGQVTDRWREFMKSQIRRARLFFNEAEKGAVELDKDSRWPVWASLILYRGILDAIEANDYNNFTKRAYVGKWKKLLMLPAAYGRALVAPPSNIPRFIRV